MKLQRAVGTRGRTPPLLICAAGIFAKRQARRSGLRRGATGGERQRKGRWLGSPFACVKSKALGVTGFVPNVSLTLPVKATCWLRFTALSTSYLQAASKSASAQVMPGVGPTRQLEAWGFLVPPPFPDCQARFPVQNHRLKLHELICLEWSIPLRHLAHVSLSDS